MTTMVQDLVRGVRQMRAAVTLDGREVDGRLFPLGGGGRGIDLVGNKSATYEELYRTQIWVQAVVNRLARSLARLPLKVFVSPDEPSERERVREGPLADLLALPGKAPGRRMGKNAFVQAVVSNVAVHGNCVAVKVRPRAGMPPAELVPTSFAYWSVGSLKGEPVYRFSPGSGAPVIAFRPEEVVHFRWWPSGQGLVANSPLDSLRTTLMTEDAAQRMTIASFENGARPSGAFSIDGSPPKEVVDRNREMLHEIYGGVDNTAKMAVLTAGAKWMAMSHTLVDSELINLRKLTREEVAAAYNMPPPVVGILDRATFSNISEQHLMEYMDTIQPWGSMIEEALAVQLIGEEPLMVGEYAEFDYGGVLAGDPIRQIEILTKAAGGAILTADEARGVLNRPPLKTPRSSELAPPQTASKATEGANGDGRGEG